MKLKVHCYTIPGVILVKNAVQREDNTHTYIRTLFFCNLQNFAIVAASLAEIPP